MITIKNKTAIEKMATAGRLLNQIFEMLPTILQVGISTLEVDSVIAKELKTRTLVSKMKGYKGYGYVSCISLNDVVVHGVPGAQSYLKEGDLVKIDVCAAWQGYCADMARCFSIGKPSESVKKLVMAAHDALEKGIEKALPGNHLSDISHAIQQEVERHRFGVVRDFAGHGIGRAMHEDPEVLNYGSAGRGPVLRPGMVFALEPMITQGHYDVYIADDGWTVKTTDKSLAAHVEDTVAIMQDGPRVLTRGT